VGRQDRIRELGQAVGVARRVLEVGTRRGGVFERAGPSQLAQADVGPLLVAVVEAHEAAGLERLAERDRLGVAQAPVPHRMVEPNVLDRAVLCEQLLELGPLHLRILANAGLPARSVGRTRPGPVAFGEIERQLDAVLVATPAHLGQYVPPERRLRHFAIGCPGVPQAEAVVVLGQKQDVTHAGLPCRACPLVGVATSGFEEAHVRYAGCPLLARKGAE